MPARKQLFTPQSFRPVTLEAPADVFSDPLPRQRIKRGHLVLVTVGHGATGFVTLGDGKYYAKVLETKSERAARGERGFKVLILSNAVLGYYCYANADGHAASYSGYKYSCAVHIVNNVKLVNPNQTVDISQTSGYASLNHSERGPNNWYTPSAGSAPLYSTLNCIGRAMLNASEQARAMALKRFDDRVCYAYREQRPYIYGNRSKLTTANYTSRTKQMRVSGHGVAIALRSLANIASTETVTRDDVLMELERLNQYVTSNCGSPPHGTALEKLYAILSERYGVTRRICGHISDTVTVYSQVEGAHGSTYDRLLEICETCVVDSRDSRFYRVRHPITGAMILVDGYAVAVYRDDENLDDEDRPTYSFVKPPQTIGQYHSSRGYFTQPMPHITGVLPKHGPHVGFELEFVRHKNNGLGNISTYAKQMKKSLAPLDELVKKSGTGKHYALFEYDGSVDYEMVTGFGPLDTHRAAIIALLGGAPYKGKLVSHDRGCCGLHVHIDKPSSILHAARLVEFYNKTENSKLVKSVARRYAEDLRYARAIKDKGGAPLAKRVFESSWQAYFGSGRRVRGTTTESRRLMKSKALTSLNSDRYEMVNFHPAKTVEIRVFRGSMVPETVISCLEFGYLSWMFALLHKDMTAPKFLEFIGLPEWRHESRYLRSYLEAKGYKVWMPANAIEVQTESTDDENDAVDMANVTDQVLQGWGRVRAGMVRHAGSRQALDVDTCDQSTPPEP